MTVVESTTGTVRHAVMESRIGDLTLVRDDVGVTAIYFPGHWTHPDQTAFGPLVTLASDAVLRATADQLAAYFAGERTEFDVPLHLIGSARGRELWQLLQQIPYGSTTTYGTLAAALGGGISARAVGGLVGHNPVSIIVPCHRVVGSTGKLTGYAGGLERKQFLLQLEGAVAETALPIS